MPVRGNVLSNVLPVLYVLFAESNHGTCLFCLGMYCVFSVLSVYFLKNDKNLVINWIMEDRE